MRRAAVKHPVVTSAIVTVIFFLSLRLGGTLLLFAPPFFRLNGQLLQQAVADAVAFLAGLVVIAALGYVNKFYNTDKFWRGILCSGYFIVLYSFSGIVLLGASVSEMGAAVGSRLLPFWRILIWPICTLLIGLAEETFFRGIVSNLFWDKHAKDPAGVWTAALYSGLIFGLMHLFNLLGAEPSGVFSQVFAASAIGVALTAIYYRCQNLWVMIFVHGFMDFCGLATVGLFGGSIQSQVSSYSIFSSLVPAVPYAIVSLVLLRRKKVVELLIGDSAIGYMPQQSGKIFLGVDIQSSPESKKSLRRAIAVFAIVMVILLVAGVATDPMFKETVGDVMGAYIVDYNDSGEWSQGDEITLGSELKFDVEKAGVYNVTVIAEPTSSRVDMVMQIIRNGETVYQSSYGGKCTETFGVELDEGENVLRLAYSFANVTEDSVGYQTRVRIKK